MSGQSELLTIRGYVSGTGVYSLDSDLFYSTVDYIVIPKGLKAKIWCKRISGEAADVRIEYTYDYGDWSSPKVVGFERLASSGEMFIEKRRPIVLRGLTGKEAFRFNRVAGTGDSYIEVELELTED